MNKNICEALGIKPGQQPTIRIGTHTVQPNFVFHEVTVRESRNESPFSPSKAKKRLASPPKTCNLQELTIRPKKKPSPTKELPSKKTKPQANLNSDDVAEPIETPQTGKERIVMLSSPIELSSYYQSKVKQSTKSSK